MIKTKILITGAGGFVGRVFYSQLPSDQFVLPESTRTRGLSAAYAPRVVDITQAEAVAAQVAEFKPDVVLHLAAQSHVPTSFSDPLKTWQTNVIGTVNYLTALQKYAPEAFFLFVSSSEVYGEAFKAGTAVTEESICLPMNPYAASKRAAEIACQQFFAQGVRGVIARPFNHIGPGQTSGFVSAAFAEQIAKIEQGLQPALIQVGNLTASRDFLDVRDVCAAYLAIIQAALAGRELAPIINIASGRAVPIEQLLKILLSHTDASIEVDLDPQRLRPSDIPSASGDARILLEQTGWHPSFTLDETLLAILNDWRQRVRGLA